jgi:hypothetical protein
MGLADGIDYILHRLVAFSRNDLEPLKCGQISSLIKGPMMVVRAKPHPLAKLSRP